VELLDRGSENGGRGRKYMKKVVLVLSAGEARRWGGQLGRPKQMVVVDNETLSARVARQCRTLGGVRESLYCVTNRPDVSGSMKSLSPARCASTVETLSSTTCVWSDSVVVLLGDVFYTDDVIRRIFSFKDDVGFFGRPASEMPPPREKGEIFGMSFKAAMFPTILRAMGQVRDLAIRGAWGNLWDIYHVLVGLPLNSGLTEPENFHRVLDATEDFDRPWQYAAFLRRWQGQIGDSRLPWRRKDQVR